VHALFIRRSTQALFATGLAAVVCSSAALGQSVRYVDADAPAGGNGLAWTTAFRDLKSALTAANGNPAITQLWVAEGAYFPGATPFALKNNLAIYGGFAGGETTLAARDVLANETVLTGQGTNRVINGGTVNASAIVDGFTIRDGFSATDGGAVTGGSPTFRLCRFENNVAGAEGGAWYGYDLAPRFVRCVFVNNESGEGGAALSTYEGTLTIVNCVFTDNISGGGAVYTYTGTVTLTNSLVAGNTSSEGAAGVGTYEGTLTIRNATIADNAGAGLYSFDGAGSTVSVRNSVVWGNSITGPATVAYSCVQGGAAGVGNIAADPLLANPTGGNWRLGIGSPAIDAGNNALLPQDTFDLDADANVTEPLPVDLDGGPRRRDDAATPDTGAGTAPIVDMGAFEHFPDCNENGIEDAIDIANGTSTDIDANGTPDDCEDCNANGLPDGLDIAGGTSTDCQLDGVPDECQLADGAPVVYKDDDGSLENSLGNGGLATFIWLKACTVAEGGEVLREVQAAFGEGLPDGEPILLHVWTDPDNDGIPDDALRRITQLVTVVAPGTSTLTTFDVPDLILGPAGTRYFVGFQTSNINFPAAIDQSTPSAETSWVAAATQLADADPDNLSAAGLFGLVDSYNQPGNWLIRSVAWRDGDCNGNGIPDDCDLAASSSDDCNGNTIPDECELVDNDCNGNGTPDDCDIASGLESDCQPNGRPDSCEIADGLVFDVDGNGVPDLCEDCNGNFIPDGLDIEVGTSEDCQPDGIPDECQLGSDEPQLYAYDDALPEFWVASDAPNMAWLNRFTLEEGKERIVAIDVMYGQVPVGKPHTIYLWSDPNGDGNPDDAKVLAEVDTLAVDVAEAFVYTRIDIPDIEVGPVGTSFFVGAITSFEFLVEFPAPKDGTPPNGASWLVGNFGEIDPNDLSLNADEFITLDDLGGPFIGNWCLRAVAVSTTDCNGNDIPDDCDIASGTSTDANRDGVPDECAPCGADLDGDGTVGPADLATVLGAWGTRNPLADLDGDGIVGAPDIAVLLGEWGDC
jgi:hypothetical protein